MTRSTPSPVVLRQARGKLAGLVVPSAMNGTFRRITEGIPCSRKVNVCFSALREVENNITLASFLEHHEVPFRQPDLHPMNIIDLDIGPHQRTMKHTFSIPNFIKEHSLGHTYTSRMDPSIREELDFTAGTSNYLLMTGQEEQTDWDQDLTGTSVFLFFVEGKERIFNCKANPESPTVF